MHMSGHAQKFAVELARESRDQVDVERQPSEKLASDRSWNDSLIDFGRSGERKKQQTQCILRVFCDTRYNSDATWDTCCTMVLKALSHDFLTSLGRPGGAKIN